MKLEIKDINGKVLGLIDSKEVFSKDKPLILLLKVQDNGKTFEDTRVLKITNKYKLVLS